MPKKSYHFLTLWPWPLTYDLEKLIRSGHYHYQCVYQIWEQSIPWFLSYRVNTIAGGGRRVAGGRRLRRKTITSPDPSDTGDIITYLHQNVKHWYCAVGLNFDQWFPMNYLSPEDNIQYWVLSVGGSTVREPWCLHHPRWHSAASRPPAGSCSPEQGSSHLKDREQKGKMTSLQRNLGPVSI